jgi:hypothetical protein
VVQAEAGRRLPLVLFLKDRESGLDGSVVVFEIDTEKEGVSHNERRVDETDHTE